jgi:excisionase family DNA binding protein
MTIAAASAVNPVLLDIRAVAQLLCCSPRHVARLADAHRLPSPVKLGRLIRWRRADLDAFLANCCAHETH